METSNIKVLILFTSSELGGAEKSITRMAAKLGEKINPFLATMDGFGSWVDFCKNYEIEPILLGRRNNDYSHGHLSIIGIFKLISLLRKEKFDIIYSVGFRLSLIVRFFVVFFPKTKLINAIRWHANSINRLDKAFRFSERYLSFLVDLYICNSSISKTLLVERCNVPKEKIVVIYNGLEFKKRLVEKKKNKPPILFIAANFTPRKGLVEFLVKVIKPLNKQGIRFHLFMAGRDEMNGIIYKTIKENKLEEVVTLLGFVNETESYYLTTDVFILPSLEGEGCPTSILEAMSYSKPSIAFNVDGIPELIESGKHGFLVEKGCYNDFQCKLKTLIENISLRHQMGDFAYKRYREKFDIGTCVEEHAKSFENLLRKV